MQKPTKRKYVEIKPNVEAHLDKSRVHKRESYNDILERLLGLEVSPETGAGNGQPAPLPSKEASA